jgi:hypothetical protein
MLQSPAAVAACCFSGSRFDELSWSSLHALVLLVLVCSRLRLVCSRRRDSSTFAPKKGDFRWETKVQGPMNSSNLNGWKLKIGPKAFRRRSKTKKWQIEAKPTTRHYFSEGKSVGLEQKTELKGELLIWRTKNQARDQEVESNSRIQFASNQSKLVPRKLDSGPLFKVGLSTSKFCFTH